MVGRKLSLKSIGRKKICFHLDQLVYLAKEGDEDYSYTCHLVEPSARLFGTGVMCSEMEVGFRTQVEAEEAALKHLQCAHAAMGGQKNPKGRRAAYRQRKIDEATARRRAEMAVRNGRGEERIRELDEYFD